MGYLHIYCGDGKGKTTAALGLALRAAGAGMRVNFVQFMKGGETAELETLKYISNITVSRCDKEYGFAWDMSEDEKADITACHCRLIEDAFASQADMVILDEFTYAYNLGLTDRKSSEKLIFSALETKEVVITGRDPDKIFIGRADYLSEIKCIKHPYEKNAEARYGIEY